MATQEDRIRIIVEDAHGNILSHDLEPMTPPVVTKKLSGPSNISFQIHPKQPSVQGIDFKAWGTWIHAEKLLRGERKILASGILKPGDIDPASGMAQIEAEGFSAYPKGLPWLENWNPITVDPAEIFERIWNHLQSYERGNLGVTVYPTTTGAQMLPGFGFDNEDFVIDFFAIFIRAVDLNDCGDYLEKIARDIPLDFWEESAWNEDFTAIEKKIHLAYPHGGIDQTDLIFSIGDNVLTAKPKTEIDIQWTSDVIIRGWFPGKIYSSELSNADPDRYRRTIVEEDVRLNSNERNAAWGHRKLARRQIPHYWEEITVDPYHPNAPFGEWTEGDTIRVRGNMPWVGLVDQKHRVIGWQYDESKSALTMQLMAEGAFNYDPIVYPPLEGG